MTPSSSPGERCPACGAPHAPSGGAFASLCPACLLEGALTLPTPPSSTPQTSPTPTSAFGPYVLLEELASGGMGIVYKAIQVNLNRIVAIKKLRAGSRATPEDRLRFRIEAEAAAKLQHPHIVAVHEVGVIDEIPYLCMDFIDGSNLSQVIAATGKPTPATAAQVTLEIARAVAYAHQRGVLHRDLKPSNILVDHQGRPHVTDFGLAKLVSADSSLTKTGMVMGSPSYMSPEQARGEESDVTTDVYALGAILFELLSGSPPHHGSTFVETLRQVQEVDAHFPRPIASTIPKDLETICLKCLAKDRNRRYASARLLAEDLERFVRHEPVQARPLPPIIKWARWCRRHPGWAAALASSFALGAAILLLTGLFLVRLQEESKSTRLAQNEAVSQLWAASLAQARAERWSALPGSRQRSLHALQTAAQIKFSPALLDEGAASLSLPDVGKPLWFHPHSIQPYAFNASFSEHVLAERSGELRFFRDNETTPHKTVTGPASPIARILTAPGQHPNPDRIGILHTDGHFRILDWSGNDFLAQTQFPSLHLRAETRSQGLALGNQAHQIAVLTPENRIHIFTWNPHSPSWSQSTLPTGGPFTSMAFAPLGNRLAVTSAKGIEIWTTSPPKLERRLEHGQPATTVAWHPHDHRIASGHRNGDILVWNLESGDRRTLMGHSGYVSTLAFSPRGNWLISHAWDGTSRFWQGHTGAPLITMLDGLAVSMNHDESKVAFHRESGGYGVAPVFTPQTLITLPDRLADPTSISFHPTQPWIASEHLDRILLWDLLTHKRIAEIPLKSPRCILFHPQGEFIYAFSGSKLYKSRLERSDPSAPLFSPPQPVTEEPDYLVAQTRWSLGGQAMVVAGSQYSFALSVENPEKRLYFGDYSAGSWLAISPDSQWAAISQFNGPGLTLWKKDVGLVALLRTNMNSQMDFSPDGRWLAACTERSWHLWDHPTLAVHHEESHTTGGIIPGAVRFSPNSRVLALTQDRRSIRFIEPNSGKTLLSLHPPRPGLTKIMEFSPNGRWLAFCEEDAPIRVWDLQQLQTELSSIIQIPQWIW